MQWELLQDLTPVQLTRIEVSDEKSWGSPRSVDIGLGAESAIKVLLIKVILFSGMHAFVV